MSISLNGGKVSGFAGTGISHKAMCLGVGTFIGGGHLDYAVNDDRASIHTDINTRRAMRFGVGAAMK